MNDEKKIDIILAEYQTLRAEIQSRLRTQFFSITASIVAVGALLGLFLDDTNKNFPLLLFIPWILTVFGIIWGDHAGDILKMGRFISEEIEQKKIPLLTKDNSEKLLTWETLHYLKRKEGEFSFTKSFVPIFYFIFPSVVAVILFWIFAKEWSIILKSCIVFVNLLLILLILYKLHVWIRKVIVRQNII